MFDIWFGRRTTASLFRIWFLVGTARSQQRKNLLIRRKAFSNGYAEVDFKKGSFEGGKLFLDLAVYPLRLVDKVIMTCEVVFHDGLADHLSCKKKEERTVEYCTCGSAKLDSRVSKVTTATAR
ncbi:hypothetical protein [Pseudomonas fluorescens]|uniref:hypothetical protein n=1 Tax=Pseudomonas fluorescens TaxID=294 RepID=UPI00124228DD|nr:hypothetical protein [Pseudomonas fluorescens]